MPMRPRFRLWLKKRGARRTGSPNLALTSELLYHAVFLAVGAAGLAALIQGVLLPDWRLRAETAGYIATDCEIVQSEVIPHEGGYRAECQIQLLMKGGPVPPVWASVGELSPRYADAERLKNRFQPGDRRRCWRHPEDPRQVVLQRGVRTWPWLVLLIPGSLMALGVLGTIRSFFRAGASLERRRQIAQKAARLEKLPASDALPPLDDVIDSPGVRLKHRLPLHGTTQWRMAGMLAICIVWNVLAIFFLVGAVTDHLSGRPNWTVTFLVGPLTIAGAYLALLLVRDARTATGVGVTHLEVSGHPFVPGKTYNGVIIQTGQFKIRTLTVSLVCWEIATYHQGTDARSSVESVFRNTLLNERQLEVASGKPFEKEFSIEIPSDAMHSLMTPHNEIRWNLEVRGVPAKWPHFRRSFRLCLYPKGFVQAVKRPSVREALS